MYTILNYLEYKDESIIRSFNLNDLDLIIALFENNFKKPMGLTESKKHFVWEYLNNPSKIVTILLAQNKTDKDIMAQYALLPKFLSVYGSRQICLLSQDTVTDEKYRGRGLFTLLANRLYDVVKKEGFLFTYGFPNKNSAYGFFNRLNWREIKPLPVLFKPVFLRKGDYSIIPYFGRNFITRNIYKSSVLIHNTIFRAYGKNNISFKEIKDFQPVFDDLWNRSIKGNVCVIRDNLYVKWRFFDKPENNYKVFLMIRNSEILGYFVTSVIYKFGLRILFLVDFILSEKSFIKSLFFFLDKIALHENCYLIGSITPYLYKKYFYLAGYIRLPERLFPQDLHFGFLPHNINDDKLLRDVSSINNWYITWSDIDVV